MWDLYRKVVLTEMRSYVEGENLSGISVNKEDTPKKGGMIARNKDNHEDQWYIAPEYFWKNYRVNTGRCDDGTFVNHIQEHLEEGEEVICKICGKTADQIYAEHYAQFSSEMGKVPNKPWKGR